MTIQDMVLRVAFDYPPGCTFHTNWLMQDIMHNYDCVLTFKQRRDALFRLRSRYVIKHIGLGWYRWDIQ